MLTLTQAAQQANRTRSTLFKAIKSGRLSASKDEQGHFLIDPSELNRVYNTVNVSLVVQTEQCDTQQDTSEIAALRRENELLRKQVEWNMKQLEREQEQADHWRNQATMLLTYQPATQEPEKPVKSRLFDKLFGRR
jgi:hypothetical protein